VKRNGASRSLTARYVGGIRCRRPAVAPLRNRLVLYLADDRAVETVAARLEVDPIPPANPPYDLLPA